MFGTIGSFLADNWGSIASVLGVLVTILAYGQAKSAAREARKAADEVESVRREIVTELARRTLSEELANLRHLLEPARMLVERREYTTARQLVYPGRDLVTLILSRWERVLSRRQDECLRNADRQLASVVKWLPTIGDLPKRHVLCLNAVETASAMIIEAQGIALATTDTMVGKVNHGSR